MTDADRERVQAQAQALHLANTMLDRMQFIKDFSSLGVSDRLIITDALRAYAARPTVTSYDIAVAIIQHCDLTSTNVHEAALAIMALYEGAPDE